MFVAWASRSRLLPLCCLFDHLDELRNGGCVVVVCVEVVVVVVGSVLLCSLLVLLPVSHCACDGIDLLSKVVM